MSCTDKNKLKSYASAFSSSNFKSLLLDDDYSFLDNRLKRYDQNILGNIETYFDYIQHISREIKRNYRYEYYYKNTLINDFLIGQYSLKDSIIINEFRVGSSIADIVMFNGSSKLFEIKTEYDSKSRLSHQIQDYKKIFQDCYLVVSETDFKTYSTIDKELGMIVLKRTPRSYKMEEVREPIKSSNTDPKTIMTCLRTSEYIGIVKKWYGELPSMNSFNQFTICSHLISQIPQESLHSLFIEQMKARKSNTPFIKSFAKELRQLALALKLNNNQYKLLEFKLNKPILF